MKTLLSLTGIVGVCTLAMAAEQPTETADDQQTERAANIIASLRAGATTEQVVKLIGYPGKTVRAIGKDEQRHEVMEWWLDHVTFLEATFVGGKLTEWESAYVPPPEPIDPAEYLKDVPEVFRNGFFYAQNQLLAGHSLGFYVGPAQYLGVARDSSFRYEPSFGNRFLFIPVGVINNASEPRDLPGFLLYDEFGKVYVRSDPPFITSKYYDSYDVLNPEEVTSGFLVFDVPADRSYFLNIPGGTGDNFVPIAQFVE